MYTVITVFDVTCGTGFDGFDFLNAGGETTLEVGEDRGRHGHTRVLHLAAGVGQDAVKVAGLPQDAAKRGHEEHFRHSPPFPQSYLLL